MNEKTKTGLEILQAAVLLGILGDVLLRQTPWGLNVLLFIGALAAAMIMLIVRRRQEFWNAQTAALNAALVFFAAMFVWRDSMDLKIYDTLAIFTILAVLTLPALNIKTPLAGVFHYFIGFVWSGINAAFAPFLLIFGDIKFKTTPQTGWTKHLFAILRGLLIALPLILIFGALFVAADAVFENLVQNTLQIDGEFFISHLLTIAFLSWITAGYLRGFLPGNFSNSLTKIFLQKDDAVKPQSLSITEIKDDELPKPEENTAPPKNKQTWQNFDNSVLPQALTLGAIEISIVLGLINLLFLTFVIVQIPYLFGGFEFVQNTPDFKLAEYARRGFGELVAVAALVLPILLVSQWLLRKENPAAEKIYRILAGIQIALLFVIMLSAAQRLLLLTGNLGYGLTTVRFYPMIFMIWLAVIFVWFALTVLRGAREKFAWGALWTAFFMLGALHVLNPDDYIARTNIRLMQENRPFDAQYNSNLSDDAVPVLLENLTAMSFEQQCAVKRQLSHRQTQANEENDFRSWNLSRRKARRQINEYAENFDTAGCPSKTQSYYQDTGF